jgi:hypothetical protein
MYVNAKMVIVEIVAGMQDSSGGRNSSMRY